MQPIEKWQLQPMEARDLGGLVIAGATIDQDDITVGDLTGVDLNPLISLDALIEEANVPVRRASLNTNQPALSAQLARLRQVLGDPLLALDRESPARGQNANIAGILRPILLPVTARIAGTHEAIAADQTCPQTPLPQWVRGLAGGNRSMDKTALAQPIEYELNRESGQQDAGNTPYDVRTGLAQPALEHVRKKHGDEG